MSRWHIEENYAHPGCFLEWPLPIAYLSNIGNVVITDTNMRNEFQSTYSSMTNFKFFFHTVSYYNCFIDQEYQS